MIAQVAPINSQLTIEQGDPTNLRSMIGPKPPANLRSMIDQVHRASLWSMTGVGVPIDSLSKTQPNSFKLIREQGHPASLWSMIGPWLRMHLTSLAREGRLEHKTLLSLSVEMWETHKNITGNRFNSYLEWTPKLRLISSCLSLLIKWITRRLKCLS